MEAEDSPREGGGTGCKRVDPIEAECWTRETEGNAGAEAVMAGTVTGIWDGFVPWTGISWATGHRYCIHCVLEGVPAMRPLDVP